MTHVAPTHLAVIETGFRGILEEQYGHIIWLNLATRGMKIPLDLLLCRSAARPALVNRLQLQSIPFSTGTQVFAPDYAGAIAAFLASGGRIFVVATDVMYECKAGRAFLPGVTPIDRAAAAELIASAGNVWFW
jgi:hypothetical protein